MVSPNERLREYFKSKGITQEMIAAELGVSQAYVSAILRGDTGIGARVSKKIAAKYNLSVEWILTGKESVSEFSGKLMHDDNDLKDKLLAEKDAYIALQARMIDKLEEELSQYKKTHKSETPIKESK